MVINFSLIFEFTAEVAHSVAGSRTFADLKWCELEILCCSH